MFEPGFSKAFEQRGFIRYVLRGEEGAVQWIIGPDYKGGIAAWDLGYHSHRPMYEDQNQMPCRYIGEYCYYDGSTLSAMEWLPGYRESSCDDEWVKEKLTEYYRHVFYDRVAV